jgi:hypothetical protein
MWRTLLLCLVTLSAFADQSRCGSPATQLHSNDPVYDDALSVERALTRNGYTVECVLPSKMASFFDELKGAALFRTTSGDFEVLFLPKPYSFEHLDILEKRQGNRYLYSFRGKPHFEARVDSSDRQYFVKRSTKLFIVFNAELAARLTAVFDPT